MPSAVAEAEAAAMDNAVDVWRLITASRLQYAAPRRMRRAVAPRIDREVVTCRMNRILYRSRNEQRANREKSELLAAVHPARHGGESVA